MKKLLMAQLGAEPTLQHFQEVVMNLPEKERAGFMKDIFGLAFSGWRNLNRTYRKFLIVLIKNERQQFMDFVRKDTVLGEFLYDLKDQELFVKILNLLERPTKKRRSSYSKLAFSVLLGFRVDLKIKGLSDKIRYAKAEVDDVCDLFEDVEIK